jgi:predicted DNA binding protein
MHNSLDLSDPVLLSLTYEHTGDWTSSTADVDFNYDIKEIYIDMVNGYAVEISTLRVKNKLSMRRIVNSIMSGERGIIFMYPMNSGYPKYLKLGVKFKLLSNLVTYNLGRIGGGIFINASYLEGIEKWRVLFLTRDLIDLFLSILGQYGRIKVYNRVRMNDAGEISRLVSMKSDIVLTNMEKKILITALRSGYFEYPKRVDIDKLSKELNLSKATVNEYIRNALRKILNHLYLEDQV